MKQLEEQAKLAADALFRSKKELQRLATDFEEDDRRLRQVEGQCTRLEERNGHSRRGEAADGGRARGAGRGPTEAR